MRGPEVCDKLVIYLLPFPDVTQNEWQAEEGTNDKIRDLTFTVTINNPLAKTAKINETQVRRANSVWQFELGEKVAYLLRGRSQMTYTLHCGYLPRGHSHMIYTVTRCYKILQFSVKFI